MIDLHLHLDGSLSKEDFIYLAKKDGISLGDDFPNNIYVPEDCPSLEEYLTRFALPLTLMQTKENISYTVTSLVNRLYNLGYLYAEIRFAPLLHLEKGLTEEEVIDAAISGLNEGLKNKENFDAKLILCCMRQASDEVNLRTIEAAHKINSHKIAAIDLAGPEAFRPSLSYINVFNKAMEYGLNIIIHAGEACENDSILGALELGATRIGHGVKLALDDENVAKVKDITFEFCPTSNLQTKSIKTYADNPIMKFLDKGLKVTINADNMTVSNTTVLNEFKHLYKTFNLSKEIVHQLLNNSIEASFICSNKKEKFKKLLEERIDLYYNEIKK